MNGIWELADEFEARARDRSAYGPTQRLIWRQAHAELVALLESVSPCVILMDELVRYVSQFEEGKTLSGGTYDTQLSFIQALTEALKAVPTAVLLASLGVVAVASATVANRLDR